MNCAANKDSASEAVAAAMAARRQFDVLANACRNRRGGFADASAAPPPSPGGSGRGSSWR